MSKKELTVKFVIPDTMQDKCFDNDGNEMPTPKPGEYLYGQDAQFQGRVPTAYHDNGDGTITDLNTGLMWQKTPDFKRYVFEDAAEYCNNLRIGGYDDWRLPTLKENYSLADFRGEIVMPPGFKPPPPPPPSERKPGPPDLSKTPFQDPAYSTPYINTDYFDFEFPQPLFIGQYWSSTRYVKGSVTEMKGLAAFGFNHTDGHIKSYPTGYLENGEKSFFNPGCFIRAVRGEENVYGINKFVDNGDGTITNNATGLMWQKADDGNTRNWGEALKYAEDLEIAGYDDWRLPSAKELQSIVDYDKLTIPAIDEAYFEVSDPDSYFWTNTTLGDFKHTAVYIAFGYAYARGPGFKEFCDWHGAGAQRSDPKSGKPEDYQMASPNAEDLVRIQNYVRCVRVA